jgi:predicted ATPase
VDENAEHVAFLRDLLVRRGYGSRLGQDIFVNCSGEGLEQVDRTIDIAAQIGEQYYVPRLHTVRSELLLHAQGPDSESCGSESATGAGYCATTRCQGSWELQAATSLARLWLDRGRRNAAGEMLAPIYGWFTEGFDTPNLVKAKTVLDALN